MTPGKSSKEIYSKLFEQLFTEYGPQHWWPAETPFEVMVGAILTQNTAWTNVEQAINNLKENHCLNPESILAVRINSLAECLRPSGYFNIKAKRLRNFCQWYVSVGQFDALVRWKTEKLRKGLLSVNGVGPETADDILLYAFERPVFVIDAYTRRLFSRLGLVSVDEGYEFLRASFEGKLSNQISMPRRYMTQASMFNEYHALIVIHAKNICRKKPICDSCCINTFCPSFSAPV